MNILAALKRETNRAENRAFFLLTNPCYGKQASCEKDCPQIAACKDEYIRNLAALELEIEKDVAMDEAEAELKSLMPAKEKPVEVVEKNNDGKLFTDEECVEILARTKEEFDWTKATELLIENKIASYAENAKIVRELCEKRSIAYFRLNKILTTLAENKVCAWTKGDKEVVWL